MIKPFFIRFAFIINPSVFVLLTIISPTCCLT